MLGQNFFFVVPTKNRSYLDYVTCLVSILVLVWLI